MYNWKSSEYSSTCFSPSLHWTVNTLIWLPYTHCKVSSEDLMVTIPSSWWFSWFSSPSARQCTYIVRRNLILTLPGIHICHYNFSKPEETPVKLKFSITWNKATWSVLISGYMYQAFLVPDPHLAIALSNSPRNCLREVWYIQLTMLISTIKKYKILPRVATEK